MLFPEHDCALLSPSQLSFCFFLLGMPIFLLTFIFAFKKPGILLNLVPWSPLPLSPAWASHLFLFWAYTAPGAFLIGLTHATILLPYFSLFYMSYPSNKIIESLKTKVTFLFTFPACHVLYMVDVHWILLNWILEILNHFNGQRRQSKVFSSFVCSSLNEANIEKTYLKWMVLKYLADDSMNSIQWWKFRK